MKWHCAGQGMKAEEARIVFEATVNPDGHVKPAEVIATRVRLQRWKGRKVLVSVSRWVKPKTQPQLGYYFDVVVPYWSEDSGYEKDEMHKELKKAWLPKVEVTSKLTGEVTWETPSLRDTSSEVMSTFIDRCIKEAALRGLRIPEAGKYEAAG